MQDPGGNERFLELFDRDPREAERKYRMLRGKLMFYFRHNGCPDPEDLADEVFSRVLRRNAGDQVDFDKGVSAYCFGVAGHVLQESRRRRATEELPADVADPEASAVAGLNRVEQHVQLQQGLKSLPEQERRVLLRYYREDRVALARELRMTENGLRLRVFRIRRELSETMEARAGGNRRTSEMISSARSCTEWGGRRGDVA